MTLDSAMSLPSDTAAAMTPGVVIETGAGPVGVDTACSGIRSFQASVMVGLFLGELFRYGFLRRMILLLGGIGVAFLCNVVRTTWFASATSKVCPR